ncbi:unnamed protein product [Absidia cylindrospora]
MNYEDISNQRAALSEKLKSLQVELKFLSQTAKKEYDDLHKARHFSVRSAAATLKGKKKALIAKEEAEYQQAFETEQRAKRNVDIVSSDLASICEKEKQLKEQKDHLKNIRSQLEGLLDEVFAEPDGTQVLEPQLRAELLNYTEQTALAKRDLQRFRDTDHNIVNALRSIGKAKEILKVALNFVPFFGTSIIDEQQVIYIEACQRTVWECQRRLNIIRDILPEIPYPNTLDVVTNNYLLGLRFEGGYVDLSWKAKAQQGFGVLVTAEKNVKSAMQWVRHYLRYSEGAIERLTVALDTTKASLYSERRRIFDQTISIVPSASEVIPNAPHRNDILDDVPPPVYEPPIPASSEHPTQNPEIPVNNDGGNLGTSPPFLDIPSPTMDSGRHLRTASQSSSVSSIPSHPPPAPPPRELTPPTSSPLVNNVVQSPTNATADRNSHPSYTTSNLNNPFRSSLPPPN